MFSSIQKVTLLFFSLATINLVAAAYRAPEQQDPWMGGTRVNPDGSPLEEDYSAFDPSTPDGCYNIASGALYFDQAAYGRATEMQQRRLAMGSQQMQALPPPQMQGGQGMARGVPMQGGRGGPRPPMQQGRGGRGPPPQMPAGRGRGGAPPSGYPQRPYPQ